VLSFLTTERLDISDAVLAQATNTLSGTPSGEAGGDAAALVRASYFEALNALQAVALPLPQTSRPDVRLRKQDHLADGLLSVFHLKSNWPDEATADELYETMAFIEAAFEQLESADASCGGTFSSLVSHRIAVAVFAADFSGGGMSEAHNLGLVCFGMGSRWPDMAAHFAETFIHEAVHQALFLEDMLHRVFKDEARARLSDRPLEAYSTTRATNRPYDVAFHAACVTSTLAEYRRCVRPTASPAQDASHVQRELQRSVRDLEQLREQALTSDGNRILDELIRMTSAIPS
jgi:hypothetical protein